MNENEKKRCQFLIAISDPFSTHFCDDCGEHWSICHSCNQPERLNPEDGKAVCDSLTSMET